MKIAMRLTCFFLILLFATKPVFSQVNIKDSSNLASKSAAGDSLAVKKGDSLSYATIYFYRSFIPKMNAPLKKVPIYINDSLVYNLKANTIISLKVLKEGKYNIAIDNKGQSVLPVRIKFGKEYFFKCEVATGLWFGKPTIQAVTPKVGRAESGLLESEQQKSTGR